MTNTTLYYFFSTIAQVLAAISALLAVFTHFKINEIREFLVGDGKATYERMKLKEPGYELPTNYKIYLDRLRDSIGRKSILGILQVIQVLAKYELDQNKTIETKPRGLQYLERGFNYRMLQIKNIKSLTKKSLIFAFTAILAALVSLIFVENIKDMCVLKLIIIVAIIILTTLSMTFTVLGIYEGLKEQKDV